MKKYKVIPLSVEVVEKIRKSEEDDYGHSLIHISAPGKSPCRFCLSDGSIEQKSILFSYMPFEENKNPYSEVGPIYIHDNCEQYRDVNVFPPDFKKREYLQGRGYDADQKLIIGDLIEGYKVEEMIDRLFQDPKVEYLHIRNGKTGCYFLKIERV